MKEKNIIPATEIRDQRLIEKGGKCCGAIPYFRGLFTGVCEYQCVACGARYYEAANG